MLTTVVTTMLEKPKEAFYSVMGFSLIGLSAPLFYTLGMLQLPNVAEHSASIQYSTLMNAAFALPQIIGISIVLSGYIAMYFLGYSKGIAPTFFVFIKPFYASTYLEVRIEKHHLDEGKKSSTLASPICIALADLVEFHGYRALYVMQIGDKFKIVTEDATILVNSSPRINRFLDDYNRFKPMQPTLMTLKVDSVALDSSPAYSPFTVQSIVKGFSSVCKY